jgi:glutaminyl-peptide cyclotransferase
MKARYSLIIVSTLLVLSCAGGTVTPPSFDGGRAFGYLEKQVSFGPRVPGSPAWTKCREYFYGYFQSLSIPVDSQAFSFNDPYSHADKPLVNLIAHVKGSDHSRLPILLAAHWDSRPRCDNSAFLAHKSDSLPGANDGASGVAVLMELANLFSKQPPAADIDLVLLDGEDWGKEGNLDYYFLGSKHFASQGIRGKYQFGILLDMVGGKEQQICREIYSDRFHKPLNDMVWQTAKRLKITSFPDSTKFAIEDDHISLNIGGVPTIDLIDFDYMSWHTEQDTPDKCSAESLANVGRILAFIAYNRSIWPSKP